MLETQLSRLSNLLNAKLVPGSHKYFDPLNKQLDEYFAGKRKEFDLPLVLPGTPFQKRVWAGLQAILSGSTRSYKEQAEGIGSPNAVMCSFQL